MKRRSGPHPQRDRHCYQAVGNIYEPDHVNSILMAGRAPVLPGATTLADPY
jgi:hypothetical protein